MYKNGLILLNYLLTIVLCSLVSGTVYAESTNTVNTSSLLPAEILKDASKLKDANVAFLHLAYKHSKKTDLNYLFLLEQNNFILEETIRKNKYIQQNNQTNTFRTVALGEFFNGLTTVKKNLSRIDIESKGVGFMRSPEVYLSYENVKYRLGTVLHDVRPLYSNLIEDTGNNNLQETHAGIIYLCMSILRLNDISNDLLMKITRAQNMSQSNINVYNKLIKINGNRKGSIERVVYNFGLSPLDAYESISQIAKKSINENNLRAQLINITKRNKINDNDLLRLISQSYLMTRFLIVRLLELSTQYKEQKSHMEKK